MHIEIIRNEVGAYEYHSVIRLHVLSVDWSKITITHDLDM